MSDDLRDLPARLETRWLGRRHEHHRRVVSTNDRAMELGLGDAPHGTLVTADEQSAGRGRRGRTWHSDPAANLCATVLLRPRKADGLSALTLVVGLGLAEGLALPDVTLKWPNDLLWGGLKLGGILCECRWQGSTPTVAVGFGINVHQREFGAELDGRATSLSLAGVERDRTEVLALALGELESVLDVWDLHGFGPLRDRYLARCPWLGQPIRVDDPSTRARVVARAEHVDPDGALVVSTRGRKWRVDAGEILLAGRQW